MSHSLCLLMCASMFLLTARSLQAAPSYKKDIAPIFKKYCQSCHGSLFPQKKLRLNKYKNVMKGSENGPVVVPGDAKKSLLYKGLLLPKTDVKAMPPKEHPALSQAQIGLIREWILAGAGE